jgi:hypothetical protein
MSSVLGSVAGAVVSGLFSKSSSKKSSQQTQQTTTTSTSEPWSGAKPYLLDLYKQGAGIANQGVPTLADYLAPAAYFPYQTTTAYNPDANALAGLQQQLGYAGSYLPALAGAQFAGYGNLMAAPDVANNPYVQAMNAQTTRNMLTAGQQLTGEANRVLGNNLQDANMASQQGIDYLGRTLGNRLEDFGLASGQAVGDFGRTASQATGQMGRMLGNTLDDWRANYQRTKGDIQDTLTEQWLPGLRSGASLAGQYGGTRQGVAEGVAASKAQRTLADLERSFGTDFGNALEASGMSLGDTLSNLGANTSNLIGNLGNQYGQAYESGAVNTSNLGANLGRGVSQGLQAAGMGLSNQLSNLYNALGTSLAQTNLGAYGQGLDAQLKAMTMAPQIAQLGMLPGQVMQGVGNQLDAYRQQQIDAEKARFDYEQQAARAAYLDAEQRAMTNYGNQWMPVQQMNSVLSGVPVNTTQTQNQQASAAQPSNMANDIMGGAMLGNSIYKNVFGQQPSSQYGAPAGLFTPEVMGAGQFGPPAQSLWSQWTNW